MTRDQAHKLTFQNRQNIIENECQYIFEAIRKACQEGQYGINIAIVKSEHIKFLKQLGYAAEFVLMNQILQQAFYWIHWD